MTVTKISSRSSFLVFRDLLEVGQAFDTYGALRAARKGPYPVTYGQLSSEYRASVDNADYVVFSYVTPIAWRDRTSGEWTMPDERYSQTTSCHQGKIRTALSVLHKRYDSESGEYVPVAAS